MRRDTLLSPGRLALPPFPPPPFTVSPGARPIISGMHGCGGWLGLVLYIGPGWGYGGGPRHGVGRCGLPFYKREGRSALVRVGPPVSCPWSGSHCDPTRIGFWEIGFSLGCAGGEESSLGSLERFLSDASNGARVGWGFLGVLVLRARKVEVGV
eukprot:scaffold7450_cov99-Isochrysis_galbana.AAC.1